MAVADVLVVGSAVCCTYLHSFNYWAAFSTAAVNHPKLEIMEVCLLRKVTFSLAQRKPVSEMGF